MRVPLNKVKAHLIPSYLLSLNDEGELGIKIVENEIVKFLLIQIIEDGLDGLWVSGLPDEVTIITVGQEYVINGQNVNVQLSEI
jgi:multidrug efflux system membrane fusion protein